ncbi:MAG: UDP-2,3-diacylglucosamine diphosphatase [Fibrobacterota bacterium]
MARTRTYFISDAHLGSRCDGPDTREVRLAKFCTAIEKDARALYLLGDIFDFWFEYRNAVPAAHLRALAAFRGLVDAGVPVTYVGGNHDFWIGDYLTREAGLRLVFAPLDVTIDGLKINLRHGDGFAPHGRLYPFFRAVVRNRVNRALYRLIHPDIGIPLARWVSSRSRMHNDRTLDMERVTQRYRDAARAFFEADNAPDALLMGHTHRADLQHYGAGTYINTGEWLRNFDYTCLENGQFSLKRFS